MTTAYQFGEEQISLACELREGGSLLVTLPDGSQREVRARLLPSGDLEIEAGGRVFALAVAQGENGAVLLAHGGRSYVFAPALARRSGTARKAGSLTAPMTGVVAEILVSAGQSVEAYQSVAVVEAMKVLATLESPVKGVVKAVHFQKGERVEHGAIVVEIEPSDA